jgi:DNA transformation protein
MPSRKDEDFLEYVLDQLSRMPALASRRMFGAIGLYQGPVFFAIIDDGILYFATDDETRARYEARGMQPFEYAPGQFLRRYYPVPVDVLEDDSELEAWAREAVAAQSKRKPKRARKPAAARKRKS